MLILDGAMGTMIQKLGLKESDFRGSEFAGHTVDLTGDNDVLCITRPDAIAAIHRAYIDAGADIISTNSFNSNRLSQRDYGLEEHVVALNRAAVSLARRVADEEGARLGRRILVAGSMSPTSHSLSLSDEVTFAELRDIYTEQAAALIEGGADMLLLETVFDTLNLKAALEGIRATGAQTPVMVSLTVADKGGHTLSGQTIEAFVAAIAGMPGVMSIGLNCSFGPRDIIPHLELLHRISPLPVSCHPNAGLPDENGLYCESPESFAETMRGPIEAGMLDIVGGCCGTTPDHIRALAAVAKNAQKRIPPTRGQLVLSGLEALAVDRHGFTIVGERCNVAGSRKFLRLIKEENFDEALRIAADQIGRGAQIIDINLDDPMIDAPAMMARFLRLASAEPEIARVPVMIDSSNWNVIEAGLSCLQGKGIVNSISLKEGEEVFLRHARRIRELGAAVVVMAFDEQGQAVTYERKCEICARAYRLLTEEAGFDPSDIIFDPNILTVATGIAEHDRYALDFIRATEWITANLPGAHVSGGVSNLSFAFRGQNYLREAMHSVFLYHARRAGMDMAIVNPATMLAYEEIEPELRGLIEDVILARRPDAAERLTTFAQTLSKEAPGVKAGQKADDWRCAPAPERLTHAIVHGIPDFLEGDIAEVLARGCRAVEVVEGPLMAGMNTVGRLFGEGKMFLPQVVKTARTMKQAVEWLRPAMEAQKSDSSGASAGRILFATVKGDVHDIGKNIVAIVLECNNFEVIDLGVMVPAEEIVAKARELHPDIICLSGLITPSLGEMRHVAERLEQAGLDIPLIVGGAATSRLHTALKIAPAYSAPVIHARDAAHDPIIASALLNPTRRLAYERELRQEQEVMRSKTGGTALLSLAEARSRALTPDWSDYRPTHSPCGAKIVNLTLNQLLPKVNWKFFFMAWGLAGKYMPSFPYGLGEAQQNSWLASLEPDQKPRAEQALQIYRDAMALLGALPGDTLAAQGAYAMVEANSQDDDIIAGAVTLPMLRSQSPDEAGRCVCLADYVMPAAEGRPDCIGEFVVTARPIIEAMGGMSNDRYRQLLAQTLADRFAEAASEALHDLIGPGIRPAIGYPSIPDQLLTHLVAPQLPIARLGVTLTENGALSPSSTVCGLYITRPGLPYFAVGPITAEQLESYAQRRGIPSSTLASTLAPLLE